VLPTVVQNGLNEVMVRAVILHGVHAVCMQEKVTAGVLHFLKQHMWMCPILQFLWKQLHIQTIPLRGHHHLS
jgi:hypothetical protein